MNVVARVKPADKRLDSGKQLAPTKKSKPTVEIKVIFSDAQWATNHMSRYFYE